MASQDTFQLYSFYNSSCCQRIIIAAHLKGIPLEFAYLNLGAREHQGDEYKDALNPSGSVPTLVIHHPDGEKTIIRQSMTILEYFDERFPDTNPLLPPASAWKERIQIRDLVNIIAIDVQPVTNSRICKRLRAVRDNVDDQINFARQVFTDGLTAYEALLSPSSKYSFGDQVTLADVVLVPTVDQAIMYKTPLDFAPNVKRVYDSLKELESFKAADYRRQGDTPEQIRLP
ncbi:thioredoxin-like protein [Aspergillus heteromorphus CBS 117.55]|uniref:Thioredoxin-like protein n=1 Tax=Aspergillus heteromorphus CBS 117.55 TaxID=1448321 RepID=A0A317WYL2_9EURO|nr:thioredoxin-like protein [Aspergillus heteromorphus CBS 117.55]PWY91031.1 thioredoxin-like protein [Aspergillus heteromorphus CBS 117.55]